MMNSFNLALSGKHFVCPSILNDSFVAGRLCPAELSQPQWMKRKESSWTQSVVPAGKGVAIPSSGEYPKPFSKMAFIGMVCAGVHSMNA